MLYFYLMPVATVLKSGYNLLMLLSQTTMYWLLLIGICSMAILAAFYLRRRQLSLFAYTFWGLVALVLPIIGPFLVIWCQPGYTRSTNA